MSITMQTVEGRTDDEGQEIPWKVNAVNLLAANYPGFSVAKIKVKGADVEVPQLLLSPSAVSFKKYDTLEDAKSEAGERFDAAILELINEKQEDLTVKAAKAKVRDVLTFSPTDSTAALIADIGSSIQWFVEQESRSGKPTIRATLLAKVDSMEGATDSEKLQALLAALKG